MRSIVKVSPTDASPKVRLPLLLYCLEGVFSETHSLCVRDLGYRTNRSRPVSSRFDTERARFARCRGLPVHRCRDQLHHDKYSDTATSSITRSHSRRIPTIRLTRPGLLITVEVKPCYDEAKNKEDQEQLHLVPRLYWSTCIYSWATVLGPLRIVGAPLAPRNSRSLAKLGPQPLFTKLPRRGIL